MSAPLLESVLRVLLARRNTSAHRAATRALIHTDIAALRQARNL